MRIKAFFLLIILAFSQFVQADDLSTQRIKNYLKIDPVYYTKGVFKGRAIDQSLRRPVQFIPELETQDSYFVSHFYNQKQFWVAEIPKQGVRQVIAQLALFKGLGPLYLTHLQFRFLMHKPVQLYRVKDDLIKKTQTGDLIFTVQAVLPAGEEYSAIEALKGTYKMTARLTNTYDRVMLEEVISGDIVRQYRLQNLTQDQQDLLLLNSVKFSHDNKYHKDYKATTENCISASFDVLDESLAIRTGRVTLNLKNMFLNGKSPNEKLILDELRERRLIGPGDSSRIQDYK
jgi:hypothetical protein